MAERNYGRARASQFQLRFSEELHARLKEESARNERPLNAEIIYRLERSFEPSGSLHGEIGRIIDSYVEREVAARLRAIAAKIGGAA